MRKLLNTRYIDLLKMMRKTVKIHLKGRKKRDCLNKGLRSVKLVYERHFINGHAMKRLG